MLKPNIRSILDKLPDRDLAVYLLYYGLGLNKAEICKCRGMTRAQVHWSLRRPKQILSEIQLNAFEELMEKLFYNANDGN